MHLAYSNKHNQRRNIDAIDTDSRCQGHEQSHARTLASEKAALEARLARLTQSDDSAYEKALIRTFEQLIETCRAEFMPHTAAL
jgi:hypothetical protein